MYATNLVHTLQRKLLRMFLEVLLCVVVRMVGALCCGCGALQVGMRTPGTPFLPASFSLALASKCKNFLEALPD